MSSIQNISSDSKTTDITFTVKREDLKEAKLAISKFSENEKNPQKIKALKEISKAEARIQAAKN